MLWKQGRGSLAPFPGLRCSGGWVGKVERLLPLGSGPWALEAQEAFFSYRSRSEAGLLIARWRAANEPAEDLRDSSDGAKGLP